MRILSFVTPNLRVGYGWSFPPHSSNLNVCDCFQSGYLKDNMYWNTADDMQVESSVDIGITADTPIRVTANFQC